VPHGEARDFLFRYESLEKGINEFVDERFEKTLKM
jgi:hypothetical protein